jgi:hypothetical protein
MPDGGRVSIAQVEWVTPPPHGLWEHMRKGKALEYVMKTMMPLHGSYQVQTFPAINRTSSRPQGRAIVLFAKVLEGFFWLFLFSKDKVWWLCVWRYCIGKCHSLFYL